MRRKRILGTAGKAKKQLRSESLEPRQMLAADLFITEFLADNSDGIRDSFGERSDWIEVFNDGDMTANLADYSLTDDALEPDKWAFPSGSLAPGESRLVFASGRDTITAIGEMHTNFSLSSAGEYLAIVNNAQGTVSHEYAPAYPAQTEDVSYGLDMGNDAGGNILLNTGNDATVHVPTSSALGLTWTQPGFNDNAWTSGPTPIGYDSANGDYAGIIDTTIPAGSFGAYIRIPFDLTTTNVGSLQLGMRYDDGFVAYINGQLVATVNAPDSPNYNSLATGLHADTEAVNFEFFDVSVGAGALQVGENILAIHGMNVSTTSSDFLMDAQLVATSSSVTRPIEVGFMSPTTPGFVNENVVAGFVEDVEFSVPHGYYDSNQAVAITTATAGSFIAYTTDGSEPLVDANSNITNGTLYTSPVNIGQTTTLRARAFQPEFQSSTARASTYIFVDDVVNQSPNGQTPAGFPNSGVNGQELNYGIDPQIVSLYGEQAVKDSLSSLSTFSIVTDSDNLWDTSQGIYVNARNGGRSWERFTSVELIHPDGSDPGFQANAGLRIRGGFSRTDANPKHSFRFYFRDEYGDAKLEYPVFGDEGTDRFDVLDLRTPQNYSWAFQGSNENSFVREVFGRDLQGELGQPYTRSRYHNLYVNGQYWGVFQTQERVEEFYAEQYLGGDKEDYDIVKADNREMGGRTEVTNGNDEAWFDLWQLTENLASNPVANADNYWTIQGRNPDGTRNPNLPVLLDVDNLIDYNLIIFYTGGRDSGLSAFLGNNAGNNWFGLRNRLSNDEGFQFFIHDNEHSMGAANTDSNDRTGPFNTPNQDNFEYSNPGYMHQDLLASPEYRQRFIDRVQEHFFNTGVLSEQANIDRLQNRIDQVEPAIIAESARWGDSQTNTPKTKTTWQNEINSIFSRFFPNREQIVLNQLRGDGLWTLVEPPSFSTPSGPIGEGIPVFLTVSNGADIYYTIDGSDPRAIGGGINSTAIQYLLPEFINQDTVIRARTLINGEWSPLVEAEYTLEAVPADSSNTRITEIHYHATAPTAAELALAPNTGSGDYEFIEITNISDGPIDIADIQFDVGFNLTSGAASVAAGESVVFVSNALAFEARYGASVEYQGVYGPLTGLSNGGEMIRLTAADGSTIQSFTYDDQDNWPSFADGNGESLQVIDVNGDYNDPFNWLPSRVVNGTPGVNDAPVASTESIRITEINYNPDASGAEFVELLNVGSTTIDLADFRFVEGFEFEFASNASSLVDPNERVVIVGNIADFNATYGGGIPVVGQFTAGSLSNGGERLIMFDANGNTVHDFAYDDVAPWPTTADGLGSTIQIIDFNGDYSDGSNWNASAVVGGTPGVGDMVSNGDFNGDGNLDCNDINALTDQVANATNDTAFDVNGDGVLDTTDISFWIEDLKGTLHGDANLDFVVDASDFNLWNANKFTSTTAWCSGNFTGDGVVDASDFNVWNSNKFTAADAAASAPTTVPVAAAPVTAAAVATGAAAQQPAQDLAPASPVTTQLVWTGSQNTTQVEDSSRRDRVISEVFRGESDELTIDIDRWWS